MFISRLCSGIVLVIIAAITLLQGGYLLAAVLLFISLVAYRELTKACGVHAGTAEAQGHDLHGKDRKINALEGAGFLGIICYYGAVVFSPGVTLQLLILLFVMMAFMFVYVFTFPKFQASQVMSAYFCVIYAPVMLSFIYETRALTLGIYIVWMIFISSWICDTCAYLTGMMIGRHKMAPKLSPKKSIEGAIGGIAGSALVGGLYGYFVVEQAASGQKIAWIYVVISAAGAVISQVGDLAASAIKRNHDIKDYGHLIPGHGGIMDRFDSVIFTSPIIYALALLLIRQM